MKWRLPPRRRHRPWLKAELDILARMATTHDVAAISRRIGRSEQAVRQQIALRGLGAASRQDRSLMPYREVTERWNAISGEDITQERVRQIEQQALAKLAKALRGVA